MMDKRPQPITTRDEQGKAIATTHRTLTPRPKSVEELTEQRLQEGHIRFADEPIVPLSVLRLIEHLERTQDAEGVWIDADDCAALAADLRTALCNQALTSHAALRDAEVEKLREALEPFAKLQLPARCEGNAAVYSILHKQILAARQALSPIREENQP